MSAKPKIAFFDFTGCEGRQLTVIDALQTHLDLLDAVEIVQFREAMSELGDDYQIAFVEGSCTRTGDEARLLAIRERAQLVVALGACAHLGGVNAIRNWQPLEIVRRYVYGNAGKFHESSAAQPISAIIPVDAVIPGCPIDREELVRTVKLLLQNRRPQLPDYPVCAECKLRENGCVVGDGQPCLGGGDAGRLCSDLSQQWAGCLGCRGLIADPNINWLKAALLEHGLDDGAFADAASLFLTYALAEKEAA